MIHQKLWTLFLPKTCEEKINTATEILKEDHRKVGDLLEALTNTSIRAPDKRIMLLEQIAFELKVHKNLEDTVFYPAFNAALDKKHQELDAQLHVEDSKVSNFFLPELTKTHPTSVRFSRRAGTLQKLVEQHACEQEKVEFEIAEQAMSVKALKDLGKKMLARRTEIITSPYLLE